MPLHSPKSRYLLKHHKYLLGRACAFFPFTADEVRKYSPIIDWSHLVVNRNVEWDIELVEEFKHQLFEKDGVFPEFNLNESLPWSREFIKRFEDLLEWNLVADVEKVLKQADIRAHYREKLEPHIEQATLERIAVSTRYDEAVNEIFSKLEHEVGLMSEIPEWCVQSETEIEQLNDPDWGRLSQNILLNWNAVLLDRYAEKWHWEWLEMNSAVPWDLELIKRYEDRLQ